MNGPVKLTSCHNMGGNQLFSVAADGTISNNDHCIQAPDTFGGPIKTARCSEDKLNQEFIYSTEVCQGYKNINCLLHYCCFFLVENTQGPIDGWLFNTCC